MLDELITGMGEGGVLRMVCARIAEGEDPREIARKNGMPWIVMRKWLEGEPERMKEWELAKRCFADGLVWSGLEAARDATKSIDGKKDNDITEADIALADIRTKTAKLKADHFTKMAGKLSRDEWGDKQQVEVKTVHQVDIRGLLEAREARLLEMASVVGGGVVESAVVEVVNVD